MNDPRVIPGTVTPLSEEVRPQTMAWPSWMDGLYQLVAGETATTLVTAAQIAAGYTVPGDSRRYMIGFFADLTFPGNIRVRPASVPPAYGFRALTGEFALWYTLFQFGPMVCEPWVIVDGAGSDVVVFESRLQGSV